MRVKSCLLASAMALGLTLSAMHHHPAYAAEGAREAAPMVLAQNNDNRGFLQNLFNRKGDNSGAKPVYLDKGSSKTKPYDFSANRRSADQRRRSTGNVSWDAFRKAQDAQMARNIAYVREVIARDAAETDRLLAADRASWAGSGGGSGKAGENSGAKKRMIYDPEKVWTYNPNEQKSGSQPRLYNPSR